MRQRLSHISDTLKEKCPRTHKIIDKSIEMIGWTPIILMVYSQILLLSYAYYKSECVRYDSVNK